MWALINKLAAPRSFYLVVQRLQPWFLAVSILFFLFALYTGLWTAPADYQQGEAYRILFIHVPAAVLSLSIYVLMTFSVVIYFVWKIKLADMLAKISAQLGAIFTTITLVTGAIWGKPMWGTYWIWDARLTSELLLLFIYLSIISLRSAIPDNRLASKACGLLTLVGVINIPVVHFSVLWWNTLHQGATLLKWSKPNMPSSMLLPLVLMLVAYTLFFCYLLILRLRSEILTRERRSRWVQKLTQEC